MVSLFNLPHFSFYHNDKTTAIYIADFIYKLSHRIMELFASEGTPGGFIYLLRGSFLHKYLLTHTRNGFLTQLKNNSFVMTLGRNAGKAMKYLLKFQRKQAGQAAWWLICIPSTVQQGHQLSRLREGCWLSPAALAHTSTFAAKLPCSTVSANSTPGHC